MHRDEPAEPASHLDAALLAYDEALHQGRVAAAEALGPRDLEPDERADLRAWQRCLIELEAMWPRDPAAVPLELHSDALVLSDTWTQEGGRSPQKRSALSDVEQLREAVVHSGIISREDLAFVLADLRPDEQPRRVEQLVYELLQRGILNHDQATALYRAELTKLVLGPFLIVEELGRGGMGIVYRALNQQLNRYVALKMLYRSGAEAISRLKSEFRALANVVHPNLVALDELYSIDGQWFITMEWIHGAPVTDYVRGPRSLAGNASSRGTTGETMGGLRSIYSIDRADERCEASARFVRLRRTFAQLAQGLGALHQAGKLHRDIKPSNVLVTPDGHVILLDYGLVIDLPRAAAEEGPGEAAGTWDYMSPEQSIGQPLSPASDWYSVGVMLYETLTGRRPFVGSFDEVLAAKQQGPPPLPTAVLSDETADLCELCQQLLQTDPERRPPGEIVRQTLGHEPPKEMIGTMHFPDQGESPFVGRGTELEKLHRAFADVRVGHPVSVFVNGPSGIGKTALVSRFLEQLEAGPDVLVLRASCHERESVPFKAWDGIVDAMNGCLSSLPASQLESLLPDDAECLMRVFPALTQLRVVRDGSGFVTVPAEPLEVRRRAASALRQLFTRLSHRIPTVLFADDLQWGDADSAILLNELLNAPDAPPLLFIGSYRTEDVVSSPCLRALFKDSTESDHSASRRQITVPLLPPDDSWWLATALLGTEDSGPAVYAEDVSREAGGHPFFLIELARQLTRDLPHGGETSRAPSVKWESVLIGRIGLLPQPARELLHVIAVAGHPLAMEEAYQAIGSAPDPRIAALLKSERLIRATGSRLADSVEVYHDRIRETITAYLPARQRQECHARLAATLEVTRRTDPEILCVHFEAAGDSAKASRYGLLAAERADEMLAFDRAVQLYRFVLGAGRFDPAEERSLRRKLADALANAGRGAESAQQYLAVASQLAGIETVELKRRAADQLLRCGHYQEGRRVLAEALAAVGLRLPKSPRHAMRMILVDMLRLRLTGRRLREREEKEIPQEEIVRADTCMSAGLTLSMIEGLLGCAFFPKFEVLARRLGSSGRTAMALSLEASYRTVLAGRQTAESVRLFKMAEELAAQHKGPYWIGFVKAMQGEAESFLGQWRRALPICEEAEAILRQNCTGVFFETGIIALDIITSLFFLGQVRELSRRVPEMINEADQREDLFAAVAPRTYFGNTIWLAGDRIEHARREAERALAGWPLEPFLFQHILDLIGSASIDLYAGDGPGAWDRLARAWPGIKYAGNLRQPFVRILILHLRARAALGSLGRGLNDRLLIRSAERDAAKILREPRAWSQPLARLVRAGIATARGEKMQAIRHLETALRELDAWEMALYSAAAKRRLGGLIGGQRGRDLIDAGTAFMTDQGIIRPDRMTQMLAPGIE